MSRNPAVALVLVLIAIACVRRTRQPLFFEHDRIKDKHDVNFLPPPEQVEILSLGYRSAFADVLWAHVMVSQGLHTFERRRFENLLELYDAINALDPTWRTPYLLADALITFQSEATPYAEIVRAREILERGAEHLPHDPEIWLNLGQFVAFVAPSSYLDDRPEEAERWKREGVVYLQRAAELGGGGDSNVSWQALGGANILARAGELDAALRFWERTYAVTDDEELKANIRDKIVRFTKELRSETHRLAFERFEVRDKEANDLFKRELPFINRDAALVLGPPPLPARCAGPAGRGTTCATSWRQWGELWEDEWSSHSR